MLEGYFFNPSIPAPAPELIQLLAALLSCGVFLFLRRHSGVVYLGLWSLAWALESAALGLGFGWLSGGSTFFRWVGTLLEIGFALSLMAAARSAVSPQSRRRGSVFASVAPSFALSLTAYAIACLFQQPAYQGMHAAIIALVYGYSFFRIGLGDVLQRGVGPMLMRIVLACLCLEHIFHATAWFAAGSETYGVLLMRLRGISLCEMLTQTLLAFSAMAAWIQTQQDALAELRSELTAREKAGTRSAELDHLTGLQNRTALERHLNENFTGVVAVCDLDYFKSVNDRFGHLVGDELLRHVGSLIRASIRIEDEAFRWGGDEFVLLFPNQNLELAQNRMAAMELRLMTFRLRGYGLFPLGLSWGAAQGENRPLRPILEEADLQMYGNKRQVHAKDM
jgi:diguanylate cyclase (GGDEF)-like protein